MKPLRTSQCSAEKADPIRPRHTVGEVIRLYGAEYLDGHAASAKQQRVLYAMAACRTPAMGGEMEQCTNCDFRRFVPCSCGDRHCPTCQALTKERWVESRMRELLPCPYFHNVFTLPHELNLLCDDNAEVIYEILFQSVSATLQAFAERHLHGRPGLITLLHTWDQRLKRHIHLHVLTPAGALSADGGCWIPCPNEKFLFSVHALSAEFRTRFLRLLKRRFRVRKLTLRGRCAPLADAEIFSAFLDVLSLKKWVVYSKPSFAGPETVLEYFGRYTKRIAISNGRIIDVSDGSVSFLYRKRRKDGKPDDILTERIPATEFIGRVMLHVLPHHFVRVRYFGFLAGEERKANMVRVRRALLGDALTSACAESPPADESYDALLARVWGVDIHACPRCGTGRMRTVEIIPRATSPPLWTAYGEAHEQAA